MATLQEYMRAQAAQNMDVPAGFSLTESGKGLKCDDCGAVVGSAKEAMAHKKEEHGQVEGKGRGRKLRGKVRANVLTTKKRKAIPSGKFAYIAPDGSKHLPIENAAHAKAAMSRLNQTAMPAGERAKAAGKIHRAAKKFGVADPGFAKKHGLK